ncbi:hypothetical protein NC652_004398 [Populus alba x Populus x berolinensis]|nr:hypothetical protein NC652_004398 [Populus alba x Populus x berolinensis]
MFPARVSWTIIISCIGNIPYLFS